MGLTTRDSILTPQRRSVKPPRLLNWRPIGVTTMYTTTAAAATIGVSARTVRRLCEQHKIGAMVGRQRVLTATDIESLRGVVRDGPGNPTFGSPAAGRKGAQSRWK